MTSAELDTLSFLRSALSNNDTNAVLTKNADGTLSLSVDIGPNNHELDMPALQGSEGAAGQDQFPLMLMPDVFDSPADLPATGVLTNTAADIGKYWIIYQTDSGDNVTSVGAYIWFGAEFRFLPFGAEGPPGIYPVIKPFVTLVGPDQTSQLLTPSGAGTARDPYVTTLELSVPHGPIGLGAPLESFYDVTIPVDAFGNRRPTIGEFFTYTGSQVTPPDFVESVPLWAPQQTGDVFPKPYVVPRTAFNSYAGITFSATVTIATFSVPPQPYAWKPVVFGQIRMFEAELSLQPLRMGIEVRLGHPSLLLSVPTNVTATVESTGSLLFLPGNYFYMVTAVNSAGETTPSTQTHATITALSDSVNLSWNAVSGAASYNIYRGLSGLNAARINASPVVGTTFTDTADLASFTAPPGVNTALAISGTLVASGSGNTGSGVVTIMPHTSTPADPEAAMNPWNDVGYVDANHGGPDGTIYVNIVNNGLAAIWDYNASDAELLVIAMPVTQPLDLAQTVPGVLPIKVTLSAQAAVTARERFAGRGALTVTVQGWPVTQEFRTTGVYQPPVWWISGTHYLDLIAVGDGGGASTAGFGEAGGPGGSGSWAATTIRTLSTGQLAITIGDGGAGSNTTADGKAGTGVTIKDGAATKLSAAGGAGGTYASGGSVSGTAWYGTSPGEETYLGETYFGGVQTLGVGRLMTSAAATLYTFAAATAATFRPLFGNLYQFDMQVGEGVDPTLYNVVPIDYPGAHLAYDGEGIEVGIPGYTLLSGCRQGVAACVAAILATPGPFAFAAYSLGSVVASLVYNEIVSGSLTSRAADFMGAVTFGSSVREQGHTIPGGTDPGGMGCFGPTYCMTSTPAKWWDFVDTDPTDPFTTVDNSTTAGQDFIAVADAVLTGSEFTDFTNVVTILTETLPDLSAQIPAIWTDLTELVFPFLSPDDNTSGHGNYNLPYDTLPDNALSAVSLAVNYLNSIVTAPAVPVNPGPTYGGAPGGWPGGGGAGANAVFTAGGDGAAGAAWIVARKT